MTKTAYIDRVKKGIELYAAMEALTKENDTLTISYGDRGEYNIKMHSFERSNGETRRSYIITDGKFFGYSMNIDMEKSGKSFLHCYTYDLFSNETHAKLYFEHITIVETKKDTL